MSIRGFSGLGQLDVPEGFPEIPDLTWPGTPPQPGLPPGTPPPPELPAAPPEYQPVTVAELAAIDAAHQKKMKLNMMIGVTALALSAVAAAKAFKVF